MTERNAYELARMAECGTPRLDSAGAGFLVTVADAWQEWSDNYRDSQSEDEARHEAVDGAIPVYTHERWAAFVDLSAYFEDPTELGEDGSDMTRAAAGCLYLIGDRLWDALESERQGEADDDD